MASIIKANELQDFNGNSILTSDGAGTITLSSGMNTAVAAGTNNTPAFRVTNSSSQSIPNDTWTKVTFDTEDYDTNSAFASSTFTVPSGEAGKYIFNWIVQSTLDSGETLVSALYINGSRSDKTQCRQMSVGALETLVATGSVSTTLSVSDTIELYMYQNQGAAQNNSSGYTYFSGFKLIGV